ncbi:hypothetical protein ACFO0S_01540 [Chryseomicrobium palamuruense]|uniref:Lipoprotein n=1 Tax=Chryseomicrobium palamuruense TaxID=682973 RepID=A0ABV8UR24_9BACL
MKKWLILSAATLFLAACQDEEANEPVNEVEQQIEDAFGTDVAIPSLQNHEIGLAYFEQDPETEEIQTAQLIYQTTTKPMEGFTVENWAEQNNLQLIQGDLFKDAPLAELTIFPETYGSMDRAEVREIAGEEVDFAVIPGHARDTAYIGFDKEGAGYLVKYHLAQNQTIDEALRFAEQIIEGLN